MPKVTKIVELVEYEIKYQNTNDDNYYDSDTADNQATAKKSADAFLKVAPIGVYAQIYKKILRVDQKIDTVTTQVK